MGPSSFPRIILQPVHTNYNLARFTSSFRMYHSSGGLIQPKAQFIFFSFVVTPHWVASPPVRQAFRHLSNTVKYSHTQLNPVGQSRFCSKGFAASIPITPPWSPMTRPRQERGPSISLLRASYGQMKNTEIVMSRMLSKCSCMRYQQFV